MCHSTLTINIFPGKNIANLSSTKNRSFTACNYKRVYKTNLILLWGIPYFSAVFMLAVVRFFLPSALH